MTKNIILQILAMRAKKAAYQRKWRAKNPTKKAANNKKWRDKQINTTVK